MLRSRKLDNILKYNSNLEREAAAHLGKAQAFELAQEEKLKALESYFSEYQNIFLAEGKKNLSIVRYRQLCRFLENVDKAIEEQKKQVNLAQGKLEKMRKVWQEKYSHLKAIEKLVERYSIEEQKEIGRKEQQTIDDRHRPPLIP